MISIIQIKKACVREGVKLHPKIHTKSLICKKCGRRFGLDQVENYITHYKARHAPQKFSKLMPPPSKTWMQSDYLPKVLVDNTV